MRRSIVALAMSLFAWVGPSGRAAAVPPVAPPPRPAVDPARAVEGFLLFRKLQCINCHTGGPEARAPKLEGLYGSKVKLKGGADALADDAYLEESIRAPKAKVVAGWEPIMPTYGLNHISDDELLALTAYLRWIKVGGRKLPDRQPEPAVDQPRLEPLRPAPAAPNSSTRPLRPGGDDPVIYPEDLRPDHTERERRRLVERGYDPEGVGAAPRERFRRPVAPPPRTR